MKRHLNGVSLEGRWWPNIEYWLGSFVVLQGIQTSIVKNPYILVIFRGGGGPDPMSPVSGSAHEILRSNDPHGISSHILFRRVGGFRFNISFGVSMPIDLKNESSTERIVLFACWMLLFKTSYFNCSLLTFFQNYLLRKNLSRTISVCRTVWIQIRTVGPDLCPKFLPRSSANDKIRR